MISFSLITVIAFIWFLLRWHANKIGNDLIDEFVSKPYSLNKIILSKPKEELRRFCTYNDPETVSLTTNEIRNVLVESKNLCSSRN